MTDHDHDVGGSPRLPAARRLLLGVGVTVLVVLGVAVLIGRAAGFSRVRDEVANADSSWFAVCFLAEVVAYVSYSFVFRDAMRRRGGPDLGMGLSLHLTLASLGAMIAAASAGGLAVTYWSFRRAGHATEEAIVRVLGLNTLVYLVFGLVAWIAALLTTIGVLGDAPLGLTLPWLVVIPVCIVAAWFTTEPRRVERLTASDRGLALRVVGYGIGGTAWVRGLLRSPDAGLPVACAAGYWAGDIACLGAALHSVGQPLPLAELALAFATGYAAMVLPLPLGGAGGVEAAMTYALTAVGVPLAPALVAVAVYRLFGFWIPTLPAFAALAFLPRAGRSLERAATATSGAHA
ncbi:YbhN family protein [Gaiella sp.]|uniref:lysylphosphatidylglycerol synthase transmembrane domain-containing protein n=1 Tax=Gaiella sp. TaxID=2663207 RepID=UPI002E30E17F|nr:YbhN family protein [Gaiella sp.]HEX5583090.1 YbhN family protein [Gaiella sp.]